MFSRIAMNDNVPLRPMMSCSWPELKAQLVNQWEKLTHQELDKTGQRRKDIAGLIAVKYDIEPSFVEIYLHNLERQLPATA